MPTNRFDLQFETQRNVENCAIRLEAALDTEGVDETYGNTGKPDNYLFPYGFLQYEVYVPEIGASVNVPITWPEKPEGARLYKVDSNNGYQEFTNLVWDKNTSTITLADGGNGDADEIANGIIVDPIGLAEPESAASSTDVTPATTGSGGGSSGECFVKTVLQ